MKGALIILTVTIAFGLLLFYSDRRKRRGDSGHCHSSDSSSSGAPVSASEDVPVKKEAPQRPDGCCGMHAVCEKIYANTGNKPVYFDDEELDRFAGREAGEYTPEETEEFREVLLTLRRGEVAEWVGALRGRGIDYPAELHDEIVMLISEDL